MALDLAGAFCSVVVAVVAMGPTVVQCVIATHAIGAIGLAEPGRGTSVVVVAADVASAIVSVAASVAAPVALVAISDSTAVVAVVCPIMVVLVPVPLTGCHLAHLHLLHHHCLLLDRF